jgi:ADP-ribose pyrophosphatase
VVDVFLASELTKSEQHLDPDEYINVEAYTTEEVSRMIFAGEIQDSKTVSAVMAYLEYIRKN